MAITTRQLGAYAGSTSTTSIPITLTNAPNAGEYVQVIASWTYDANATAPTISGYTQTANNTSVKTQFMPYYGVWAKFATGSEGTSLTITKPNTTASDYAVTVLGHTGVDTTTPMPNLTAAAGGRASGTAPTITPSAAGRAFWVVSHQNYRAGADSNITWSASTEIGERSSSFNVISASYEDRAASVATGTRAWSIAPYGGNTDSCVAAFVLQEAVVASGPEPGRYYMAI